MASMEYSYLGSSGLRVSRLCLGTMTFAKGEAGWGIDIGITQHHSSFCRDAKLCGQKEAEEILDRWEGGGRNEKGGGLK